MLSFRLPLRVVARTNKCAPFSNAARILSPTIISSSIYNSAAISRERSGIIRRPFGASKQKRKKKETKKRGERASRFRSETTAPLLSMQEKVAREGVTDWQEIFFLGIFPLLLAGAAVVVFPDFREMVFEANYEPLKDGVKTRPLKLPSLLGRSSQEDAHNNGNTSGEKENSNAAAG